MFRYNRLPYGISSTPGILQHTIEGVLQGITKIVDDILTTGSTEQAHLKHLRKSGRELKCLFMVPSVVYLGYQIDADGLHPIPMPEKVKAVMEAPQPTKRF